MKEKIHSDINIEEMAKHGVHFGHKKSRTHPKMAPYLYGIRSGIHIIDLEKTKEKFLEALTFIEKLIFEKKTLLIVGTKIQIKNLVKEFAIECGFFYIDERWLGGTFTNFGVIKKRIDYFKGLEDQKNKGELVKYTKKERAKIDSGLKNFERKFGGIKDMESLPDAVFILSMEKDDIAVKEAKAKNVKIIAISDSDTDPSLVDYPIPANDDAVSSIRYILSKTKELILKVKIKEEDDNDSTGQTTS